MNVERKFYGNEKAGAMVSCELCGKEFYKQRAFIKKSRAHFCCIEHAQEHLKKSRRKAAACVVCSKEMTGDDLKQFWGKGGRDKSGKIHGMCRACKTRADEENLTRKLKEKEDRAANRLKTKGMNCKMCGAFAIVNSKSHWCKECADRSPVVHKKIYHKILHAECMADPKRHLNMVFRVAMRQCLSGEKKGRRTFDLLGYTVDDLKRHLERQFKPGMTWGNYGRGWHVDHIIPLSAFNFSCAEDPDFRRAWALPNLRPLFAKENMAKGSKVEKPFQPFLAA